MNLFAKKCGAIVRVVIVNWNRKVLLRACLESLARQNHSSFEVVVVDNGSSDGSVALVEEMAKTYPVNLDLIRNPTNMGFCAANNQGMVRSDSQFVALLNNDAEARSGVAGGIGADHTPSRGRRDGGIQNSGVGRRYQDR